MRLRVKDATAHSICFTPPTGGRECSCRQVAAGLQGVLSVRTGREGRPGNVTSTDRASPAASGKREGT